MNYAHFLKQAHEIVITGEVSVPSNYAGETHFIMPDEIVNYCIQQYGLTAPDTRVLDPMCGLGTIPRVINAAGGDCIGVEIDKGRYDIADTVCKNKKIMLGDFLDVDLPTGFFHRIFTSLPFDWFKVSNDQIPSFYATKFKSLLTADGFLLLDSVPVVQRGEETWPVALRQCGYLVENGFTLVEMVKFINSIYQDNASESVVMKFEKKREA